MKYVIKGIHTRKECMKQSPNTFNCEGLTALYNLNVFNFGILKNKSCHFVLSTFIFCRCSKLQQSSKGALIVMETDLLCGYNAPLLKLVILKHSIC